jgi:acetyltransferase
MADYPAHLARERRLFDGRAVTIRPVRGDDAAPERAFLERLSPENRYLRFHKWVAAPSDKLVHFLTDIDYDRHMAFVCTFPRDGREELVGEARYVALPEGGRCEFGVMIADQWHKSGIAGLLMEALIRTARERGFAEMEGFVLRTNPDMLRFARALGFRVEPLHDDATTVRIVKKL